MDNHWHIPECDSDSTRVGPDAWNIDHMIGFIVAVIYFALVLLAFGTVIAFYTSWRDGCLQRDIASVKTGLGWVFLKIKKFAQLIFGRAVRDHILNYYMYYGLVIMFFIVALTG